MSNSMWLCIAVLVLSIGSGVNTSMYVELKKRVEILELQYENIK